MVQAAQVASHPAIQEAEVCGCRNRELMPAIRQWRSQECGTRHKRDKNHYFTDKSKGFLIGSIGLLLIAAITVGLSFSLYRDNTRMKENDINFLMIRQSIPEAAKWADTTYHRNPETTEKVLKKLEAEQLNPMEAQQATKQKRKKTD